MTIIWSDYAAMQLENIYTFIENRSKSATIAAGVYNDILDETAVLSHAPYAAPPEALLSHFPENYRSLVVRNTYKVVYYVKRETVYVVSVFDCRQDPGKLGTFLDR